MMFSEVIISLRLGCLFALKSLRRIPQVGPLAIDPVIPFAAVHPVRTCLTSARAEGFHSLSQAALADDEQSSIVWAERGILVNVRLRVL